LSALESALSVALASSVVVELDDRLIGVEVGVTSLFHFIAAMQR
jgi:hypothetical protein